MYLKRIKLFVEIIFTYLYVASLLLSIYNGGVFLNYQRSTSTVSLFCTFSTVVTLVIGFLCSSLRLSHTLCRPAST